MTHLDANAITEVERLVKDATPILEENVLPGGKYLIRMPSGDVTVFVVPGAPVAATVFDLPSLQSVTDALDESGHLTGVYVSDTKIVAVSEEAESQGRLMDRWQQTLNLPLHPAFAHLAAWKRLTPLSQKDLVRLLRTELRDHVEPTVISTFSSLKFTNNSEATAQVRPTSNALDSSIRQRVAAENGQDAPETITFHVPVYDVPGLRGDQYTVTAYVEYDHDAGKFLLLTVHSELRKAQEDAVADLIDGLRVHANGRFPVLYGTP